MGDNGTATAFDDDVGRLVENGGVKYQAAYPPVFLCLCLHVILFVCPSVRPSVGRSVCVSVCLSVHMCVSIDFVTVIVCVPVSLVPGLCRREQTPFDPKL